MAYTGKPGTGPIGDCHNPPVMLFQDGTGTPVTSPLAYNASATKLIVPASAAQVIISNTTDKPISLKIYVDASTAANAGTFSVPSGAWIQFPCSGMGGTETPDYPTRIQVTQGAAASSGDVSFAFLCMTPTGA